MISGSAACRITNSKKWYRSEWYTPGKKRKGSASMLMSVALHQSRISSSHAYGLPRWNVIFRSNWLIQFIMPEVKLAIRVFYLGLLQYLIYLELRFPEGKKKVQIFDVQSPWFYFPTYFQCFRSNPGFQALQKSTFPLSHTLSSRIWIMIIKHVSSILI